MKKSKSGFFDRLFYSNKFVIVLSLLLAIALWATVKINFSNRVTKTIDNVKVTIDSSLALENEYVPFIDQDDLYVDVEISGKSYEINGITKDDIVLEANSGYIDVAGYKMLNVVARINEVGADIASVSPSTLTVFFDRKATDTFNVEARLKNKAPLKTEKDSVVGQPVPSLSTVTVEGPATAVEKLKKIYFDATVEKDKLPLLETVEVAADISFDIDSRTGGKFLVCQELENDSNTPTVIIPVTKKKTVNTSVKFVGEPAFFAENPPKYSITPSNVEVTYNSSQEEYESYNVGTISFSNLKKGRNVFTFPVDEKSATTLVDKQIKQFTVVVEFWNVSETELDATAAKTVFLNQIEGYKYTADLNNAELEKVMVIGKSESLKKITADMLQIEINVSSLDVVKKSGQYVEISNISIQSPDIQDCWIYGKYKCKIRIQSGG